MKLYTWGIYKGTKKIKEVDILGDNKLHSFKRLKLKVERVRMMGGSSAFKKRRLFYKLLLIDGKRPKQRKKKKN